MHHPCNIPMGCAVSRRQYHCQHCGCPPAPSMKGYVSPYVFTRRK